ncbi:MAG TPA: hypothetical protein VGI87_12925 [Solirubrobacteraceae bacterium]
MARIARRCTPVVACALLACAAGPITAAQAAKHKAKSQTLVVCKHGCRYSTIQQAVNHSGRKATIDVRPGKYVEGVFVKGHRHDGLHIIGIGKKPSAVVIEGRHAHGPEGAAQNGIEGDNVNNLDLENMKAEHFASNGFFINGCKGYEMKDLIVGFNHSYGMYVFKCVGGRMTQSVGYGNGDSAFYVGGTPFQKHPIQTTLDHLRGYENVLGYSGTNSKYVVIRDSEFYNNGAGIVPNTLQSEPWQPASSGLIEHNLVYWNNFDYYRPGSPVRTVSSGVGSKQANYPIGAGVMLFGTTDWTVKDNSIFGNFLWGAAAFSDPTNPTQKAVNDGNRFIDNKMGGVFNDANGADFYNDGSGRGTCFEGNSAGSTFDHSNTEPDSQLYASCPNSFGTGTTAADSSQFGKLAAIVLSNPPTDQEKIWHVHAHPPRKGRTPFEG